MVGGKIAAVIRRRRSGEGGGMVQGARRRDVVAGLLGASLLTAGKAQGQMDSRRFDFTDRPSAGWTPVPAASRYSAEAGWGFEPGEGLLFSVAVPEGDYRVTLEVGEKADLTVKAESRRLMVERLRTEPGRTRKVAFVVNVRNAALPPPPKNAPGGLAVTLNPRETGTLNWDDRLTIEFCGPAPNVARMTVEPVEVARVFLLGDSTVTDQPYEPAAGWGQMLPRFFAPGVSVANHAESGETLKSFLMEHRLDKVLSQTRAGDFALIQFGHNDQKENWPQTYVAAATTYRDYLKAYVGEFRRRGATPVLVTSMHRRRFDEAGRIVNTHGDYAAAVLAVGAELGVPVVDLAAMSKTLYEALGPTVSPKAFADEGRDLTHHNNYGAYLLAQCVVKGVRASAPDLARHLAAELAPFDPARPTAPDAFTIAPSAARSDAALRGN